MELSRKFFLRFYLPIMTGVVIFLVALLTPKLIVTANSALESEISVLFVTVKIPVEVWKKYSVGAYFGSFGIAFSLIFYGATTNFSNYFPNRLKMDVYFDVRGLERVLQIYTPSELAELSIDQNWKNLISEYDSDVISSLKMVWQSQGKTDPWPHDQSPRDVIHGSGETTFIVERKGFLSYKVSESKGVLQYVADFPRRDRQAFKGFCSLRDSASSYIRPNVFCFLRRPVVVISPEIMQVFHIEKWNDGETTGPFDHLLRAVTKVTIIPFPSFSDSIYLWKASGGKHIPVAYCVYH